MTEIRYLENKKNNPISMQFGTPQHIGTQCQSHDQIYFLLFKMADGR